MVFKIPENLPQPERLSRRTQAAIWGLVVLAVAVHVLVCDWSTKPPDRTQVQITRVPNPVRFLVGQGPRFVVLSTFKRVGLIPGALLGLALPLVMIAVAGFMRFNAQDFSQIAGAGLCVLLGFALVVFLIWAFSHW